MQLLARVRAGDPWRGGRTQPELSCRRCRRVAPACAQARARARGPRAAVACTAVRGLEGGPGRSGRTRRAREDVGAGAAGDEARAAHDGACAASWALAGVVLCGCSRCAYTGLREPQARTRRPDPGRGHRRGPGLPQQQAATRSQASIERCNRPQRPRKQQRRTSPAQRRLMSQTQSRREH